MSGVRMMRRRLGVLLAAACLAACGGGAAGGGAPNNATPPDATVAAGAIKQVAVPSGALKQSMAAAVYLPPGYNPAARYPVLYLFYGYGGNKDSYFGGGLVINRTADRLIAMRAIEPLIIVVPDYDNSFGVNSTPEQSANSAGGSVGLYEDYLIGELVLYIDGHFSTDARREKRYVGGVSMGGFAALHLGLRHTAMFSKVGGHSAALWTYSAGDQFLGQRNWLYPTPELRAQRDPLLLAATADLRGMRFYLDAGHSDALREQGEAMSRALQAYGGSVEFNTSSGGHDVLYWAAQLEKYLLFYNR